MNLLMKYRLLFFIGFLLIINGCIMGMHNSKTSILTGQSSNLSDKIEIMLVEMIEDLSSKNLDIETITVWDIQSESDEIDLELIRQQLINQLVNKTNYQVVSRKRLKELLEEKNLSLSGVLDVDHAIAIGKLVGIEGFMDGYLSVEQDQIKINLSLIDAKRGVIIWVLSRNEII